VALQSYVAEYVTNLGNAVAGDVSIIPPRPDAQGVLDAWRDMREQCIAWLAKEPGFTTDNAGLYDDGQGLVTQLDGWVKKLNAMGFKLAAPGQSPVPSWSSANVGPALQNAAEGLFNAAPWLWPAVLLGAAVLLYRGDSR
jgi:hypothetical protein